MMGASSSRERVRWRCLVWAMVLPFPAGLPLSGRPPGATVLVAGAAVFNTAGTVADNLAALRNSFAG